jgi:phosphopantetheinyl transferase
MAPGPRVEVRVARLPPLLAEATAAGEHWMCRQERERLAAMRSSKRRDEFLAGHWLARRLAADCFGGSPHDYLLESEASGAPRLRSLRDDSGFNASLSHSGEWIAAALAPFAVGIDVESARKPRDLLALAATAFSPAELEALHGLGERERPGAFYRLWTAREAVGKREGHGLRLEVSRAQCMQACAADVAELLCWSFEGLSLSLAGPPGLQARPDGIPDGARANGYRIVAAA